MPAPAAPFYIDDVIQLREKLARAEREGTRMGRVWAALRSRARTAPDAFPWFTPFVALITGEERDLESARRNIRRYVKSMDAQPFGSGLQFHFWCFAFPHTRWALYFQWLQALGAWSPEEEKELSRQFVSIQFIYFFSGMRTKPEPECVDNQSMSLCFSNALIGHLFGSGPNGSAMARRMAIDGVRRLPGMIGGMSTSGYSGEGSTYMDGVVGPSVPFLVEFLERTQGGDWYDRKLPPSGGSAASIARIIAREWTPAGLCLPWDHYGYHVPVRACITYAARRTKDPFYFELLEKHASWTHDRQVGWGYDDLVWSLIWWPEERPAAHGRAFVSWVEPEVGAAVVSPDSSLYLMQMWDRSEPVSPSRAHVNPNALVLTAHGVPLTVDGVPTKECTLFNYEDTWREVGYMDVGVKRRFNFGSGCAGSHSVLLVDGWEGMRAMQDYPQARLVDFSDDRVTADVTPIYAERWPDTRHVVRRSRQCEGRFWLIEDWASFANEHEVTARFWLRPEEVASSTGVAIETAEGVRLRLRPLVGPDSKTTRRVAGYPDRLDGASLCADWTQRGQDVRWLWLAWPDETRRESEDVSAGWSVLADLTESLGFDDVRKQLAAARVLPFTMAADLLADIPTSPRWWYRRTLRVPAAKTWWLRLPARMRDARLWVQGREVDISAHALRSAMLAPHIEMPGGFAAGSEIEVVVRCNVSVRQYDKNETGGSGFEGRPAILVSQAAPEPEARYENNEVVITAGGATWKISHRLMTQADLVETTV